jgi:hypothetical protein
MLRVVNTIGTVLSQMVYLEKEIWDGYIQISLKHTSEYMKCAHHTLWLLVVLKSGTETL